MQLWRWVRLVMAMVAVCVLTGSGWSGAAEPKRPTATATTWHDYYREALEINRRTLSGAYKQVGSHGAWDDAAVAFLDQMAVYFTYGPRRAIYRDVEPPDKAQAAADGKAVLAAGCDDPLVAYCVGVMLRDAGDRAAALPLLRAAPGKLDKSKYPDRRVWAAARRLAVMEPDTEAGRAAAAIRDARALRLASGLTAGAGKQPSGVERRERLASLSEHVERLTADEQAKFVQRLRQQGDADPWIVDALDGDVQIELAWAARGSGWANTVTPEGWVKFGQHLKLARDRLTAAWKRAPQLPEPATRMITVAMGAGDELGERADTWFNRALAAQLDYTNAHWAMLSVLQPRWHGTQQAMYALGVRAAATKRYDTDAPWQLLIAVKRIVWDGSGDEEGRERGWSEVLSRPGVYDQLVKMADAYESYYRGKGKGEIADWYRTFQAALAWRAGKYDDARLILEAMGERAALDAFEHVGAKDRWMAAGQVFAVTNKAAGADVRRGDEASAEGRWDAAAEAYAAALAALPKGPSTRPARGAKFDARAAADAGARWYVEARNVEVTRTAQAVKGQPVDVQPNASFAGWRRLSGQWDVTADGMLSGARTDRVTPCMVIAGDVGTRYELSGKVAHQGRTRGAVALEGAGNARWCWVVFYERSVVVHFPGGDKSFKRDRTPGADFVVRYDAGTLNVRVNDKAVIDDFALPEAFRKRARVGVAAMDGPAGQAVFADLKLRRLPGGDAAKTPRKPTAGASDSDAPDAPDKPPEPETQDLGGL